MVGNGEKFYSLVVKVGQLFALLLTVLGYHIRDIVLDKCNRIIDIIKERCCLIFPKAVFGNFFCIVCLLELKMYFSA